VRAFSLVEEMNDVIYENTRGISLTNFCKEGERKEERRKLRSKTETLYHEFSGETNGKERTCAKRTKEGEKDRNGAHEEKERA